MRYSFSYCPALFPARAAFCPVMGLLGGPQTRVKAGVRFSFMDKIQPIVQLFDRQNKKGAFCPLLPDRGAAQTHQAWGNMPVDAFYIVIVIISGYFIG
jgi:hypothetical protein